MGNQSISISSEAPKCVVFFVRRRHTPRGFSDFGIAQKYTGEDSKYFSKESNLCNRSVKPHIVGWVHNNQSCFILYSLHAEHHCAVEVC